ncbi:hypothetical protein CCP4SC76_6860001 [Gammaproteobacteria bacterium]
MGHYQPLSVWLTFLYLMGLNVEPINRRGTGVVQVTGRRWRNCCVVALSGAAAQRG